MLDCNRVLLKEGDPISRAIEVLEKEALIGIVLIINSKNELLGTITDGDIRRALINKESMEAPLGRIMNCHPVVAQLGWSTEDIWALGMEGNVTNVPVVDDERHLVGLKQLSSKDGRRTFENRVVIMAGGFGKRLQPLTDAVPKPLLKIGGRPILERILDQFVLAGFQHFFFAIHYKADMISEYFGDGSKWGVDICYIREKNPLGTAGALGCLPNNMPDLPIVVMNSDLLTKVNFERLIEFHREQERIATMCVREYDVEVPYGVVDTEEHSLKSIIEKPIHRFFVNAGIYVLNKEILEFIDVQESTDMPNLIKRCLAVGKEVAVFPVHEYWLDIGATKEYEIAQTEVRVNTSDW